MNVAEFVEFFKKKKEKRITRQYVYLLFKAGRLTNTKVVDGHLQLSEETEIMKSIKITGRKMEGTL